MSGNYFATVHKDETGYFVWYREGKPEVAQGTELIFQKEGPNLESLGTEVAKEAQKRKIPNPEKLRP